MSHPVDDYYYNGDDDDDGGFSDYDITTVQPGSTILIATVFFCVSLYAFLPCVVALLDRCQERKNRTPSPSSAINEEPVTSKGGDIPTVPCPTTANEEQVAACEKIDEGDDQELTAIGDILSAVHDGRGALTGRRNRKALLKRAVELDHEEQNEHANNGAGGAVVLGDEDDDQTVLALLDHNENAPIHHDGTVQGQADHSKIQKCRLSSISGTMFDKLLSIVELDKENEKLYKLALPYVVQALVWGIASNGVIVIIGQLIGTRELAAYAVVDLLVGLTNQAVGGIGESLVPLLSFTRGTENAKLTGEYVQLAVIMYVVLSIPFVFMWYFITDDILLFLGFDERTAQIGRSFVTPYLFSLLFLGITNCLNAVLDVFDRAVVSTILYSVKEVTSTLSILITALFWNPSLQTVGYIYLIVEIVNLVLTIALIWFKGWFQQYYCGMFHSFAFANTVAVKMMLKTASPLTAGYLLTYGEWEILAFLASFLGPAEVAAWSILGSLWDILEVVTAAIANAAEVRVAVLLGSGQPGAAKKSAYKSIFLAFVFALISTSVIFIAGAAIPTWLTTDTVLQGLIAELIPLFGVGNITLTMGSMAWTLVGAQNRYRLATGIGIAGSWLITLPLSAVFSVVYRINLQGQTAAVVIGYMVSGFVTNVILLRSDWKKLSDEVILYNAPHDIDLPDAESPHDESSSESSTKNSSPPLVQSKSLYDAAHDECPSDESSSAESPTKNSSPPLLVRTNSPPAPPA